MSSISGKTKICGIIGDPIEHTMSPAMHNAAFGALDLDYIYLPFRVRREELKGAMNGMRALNIAGLNVTIPHKSDVIPLLNKLDPLAGRMGAVNTIVNEDGKLTGDNTDAPGFLRALRSKGVEPDGKKIVILGAGGAAKGISFILAGAGASLVILNRTLSRAEELASQIASYYGRKLTAMTLSEKNLKHTLDGADVLVNTTSVGMVPDVGQTPVPSGLLKPDMTVFDIVYNPRETRLLREAKAAGARTIDGLDMLVWQGALAFEKWTGREAPFEIMKGAAVKALGHER
ncbi:MAG TPA: shikimate dehydrogenase [Dehalococcoidia bacterium]|nr:shikimate dehydrogenase [Dehalococcoidia bacterium]